MLKSLWYQVTNDTGVSYKGLTYDYNMQIARIDYTISNYYITFVFKGEYSYFKTLGIYLDRAIADNKVTILEANITSIPKAITGQSC